MRIERFAAIERLAEICLSAMKEFHEHGRKAGFIDGRDQALEWCERENHLGNYDYKSGKTVKELQP